MGEDCDKHSQSLYEVGYNDDIEHCDIELQSTRLRHLLGQAVLYLSTLDLPVVYRLDSCLHIAVFDAHRVTYPILWLLLRVCRAEGLSSLVLNDHIVGILRFCDDNYMASIIDQLMGVSLQAFLLVQFVKCCRNVLDILNHWLFGISQEAFVF